MRVLRWFIGGLASLLLLAVVAVAGLWWWTGTEGSARWALEQLAKRQPLVAENVSGSLRRGLQAGRLVWRQEGLTAEARDVRLDWQPLALLQRMLLVDRLRAASVRVEDRR